MGNINQKLFGGSYQFGKVMNLVDTSNDQSQKFNHTVGPVFGEPPK